MFSKDILLFIILGRYIKYASVTPISQVHASAILLLLILKYDVGVTPVA
jgi:hypothetical protein